MNDNQIKSTNEHESKDLALHYMKTLAEVAREAFLILDANLKVILGNPVFYDTFHVSPAQTENQYVYDLGNGQWNISALRSLLEKILPDKKIVKNYEVTHAFETIGEKTMLLNAQQIDSVQLIILAIEDITTRKTLENKLADSVNQLTIKVTERTTELTNRIMELEALNKTMVGREIKMIELKKEIENLRTQVKSRDRI